MFRSGGHMFWEYSVQKWRINVLAIFSSEVEDKCSGNIQFRSGG
jgi:hypothetical protein